MTRQPRLTLLPLSEFKPGVVVDVLRDLAGQMDRPFSAAELRAHAGAHLPGERGSARAARPVPAVDSEGAVDPRTAAVGEQGEFESLARNTSKKVNPPGLANLFRSSRPRDSVARLMVETAFRSLAPYRLFTLAHLRYHVEDETLLSGLLTDSR